MNYNTQNAKIASITEKTLVVGIDVGSEIPGMEPTGHYWLNLGAYLQEQGMRPVPSMFYLLSSSFFHRRFSAYIQKDKSSENLPLPTTVLLLIYVSACSLLTRTY